MSNTHCLFNAGKERLHDEQLWAAQVLLDRQRERMQQQMMRMLHSQMRQYWQPAQTGNGD